ncbi:MAG: 4Fe-4S dicluster domain-containing protein [Pelotomaculaceae bacterium]|jgi:heterodisulfide reductase subunit C
MAREKWKELVKDFDKLVDTYGLAGNLRQCLACGKCVGDCPAASVSPSYNSRQIIQDVLDGNQKRVLASEEVWHCLWCAGCYRACPSGIYFPMLMMQIRYRAVEAGYGLKYFQAYRKLTLKAMAEGMSFVPGEKGRAKVEKLRSGMGMSPLPEVSDKAKSEYNALFEMTGSRAWVDSVANKPEAPIELNYSKGRINLE